MRNLFLLLAAIFAMAAQPVAAQAVAEREIGRIKNVTQGGIEVVRDGNKLTGTSGFRLREGDIVVTRSGQRAGITFVDNTRLVIAPKSRMIISRYRFDRARRTGESQMQIDRGAVGVDSGELARSGRMKFKTPTSTLGVRGTTFVIEVDE
ncbi:MAG: FecR domain-containing protein [Erythrobacter sp.]|uniref:FecR domain-containing protein n=2 Tax=Erythrobacter sp. TaxID=1042 RepID=UPI0032632194